MRTEDMLPIAEKLDQVGYFSLEVWGGATFDSCLRFLNEDPWERLRQLKDRITNTPLQMLLRGQNLVGYRHYADDIVERFVKKSVDNGMDIFRIFDALNDFRNIRKALDTVKKCGKTVEGTISYTVSPVHNVELYLKMAKTLEDMGSDIICIKDMAGLLTPQITGDLIREIKNSVKIPVHLHTHATTGLVGMNLQKAIDAGVDIIDTAISTLAMGTSQYATECIVAALNGTPRDTGLDLDLLEEIADYFKEIKKNYSQFESDFKGVDINILKSQIPGGMISNMENQLKEQNALDKMDEVLKEVPRVRKDMGYPPLVTPTSQIVGSQATLNVLTGERYKVVTKETRDCVLGKYGKLPGALDEDLLALVSKDEDLIDCRPADLLKPEWDGVVKEAGDKVSGEEDLLSYSLFPKVALKFFETRNQPQPAVTRAPAKTEAPATPAPTAPAVPAGGAGVYNVNVNGRNYAVQVSMGGSPITPTAQPVAAPAPQTAPAPAVAAPAPAPAGGSGSPLAAPLPGSIFTLKCKVGDQVNEGDTLIIMEAMKMETEVKAHCAGTIQSILVKEGDTIQTGDQLVIIG
jgi:oxaloacetate decarboxylase alpha subunit